MRQIFDEHRTLGLGDYAWFKDNHGNLVLGFRYSDAYWAFYSVNDLGFDGSPDGRATYVIREYPHLSHYRYSWNVDSSETIHEGLEYIQDGNDITLTLQTEPRDIYGYLEDNEEESCESVNESVDSFHLDGYETTMLYSGLYGYHYHHSQRMNQPIKRYNGHKIGVELEVEFDDEDDREDFISIPSNWFYRETDSSLDDYGCEIITIPLLPKDAKNESVWEVLTNQLSAARSWDTGRCGLHVHIGREILGKNDDEKSETLGKLLFFYHHYLKNTRMNIIIFGRERGYNDKDGRTDISSAAQMLGSDVFRSSEVKDRVKDAIIARGRSERYMDINITNPNTIEFRKGRGSINPTRISTVVQYCERICTYVKITPWIQLGYEDFVKYLCAVLPDSKLLDFVNETNP